MKCLIDKWSGDRVAAKWDGNKWIPELGYEDQKFRFQQKSPDHVDLRGNLIARWFEQDIGGNGPGEIESSESTPKELGNV